jgi:hypothetical protein
MISILGETGSQGENKEINVNGHLIALTLAISGWFGGKPDAATPTVDEESPGPEATAEAPRPQPFRPVGSGSEDAPAAPLKTTQIIPGDHAVMLKGRPEAVPNSVIVRVAESPTSSTLETCQDVKLVAGTQSYRVEHLSLLGRRSTLGQSRFVSEGTLRVQALDAAVAADDAHFEACGQAWPLTPAVREAFRAFLVEFRQRGGAPAVTAPEPMPAPASAPAAAPAASASPTAPGAAPASALPASSSTAPPTPPAAASAVPPRSSPPAPPKPAPASPSPAPR